MLLVSRNEEAARSESVEISGARVSQGGFIAPELAGVVRRRVVSRVFIAKFVEPVCIVH